MIDRRTRDRWIYRVVWLACFLPMPTVIYWFYTDQLGANPAKEGMYVLGQWALRMLALGLAITPLRKMFGWVWLLRFRRTFGLFAVAYVVLHITTYVVLDQNFEWSDIWKDILDRPYITIGMGAFLMLLPLAYTSTNAMIRRMGKNWRRLHRLVYIIAPLGVLHYDLMVKKDATWPHIYAVIIGLLLLWRVWDWRQTKAARAARGGTRPAPGTMETATPTPL
jgi:sulfoxide reductase heme-binding subunit YedZ